VTPETPNLEPTPNYDCHMSRNVASSSVTDLSTLMRSTQVLVSYQLLVCHGLFLESKHELEWFSVAHLKTKPTT